MRILAAILILTELLLASVLVTTPIMTSHKPLAKALNRYRASPSPETEAEVNSLRHIAQSDDRKILVKTSVLLTANTCALLGIFHLVRSKARS